MKRLAKGPTTTTTQRWTCPTEWPHCIGVGGSGKGPGKCPQCKARVIVHEGTYAVMTWRGDGQYRLADAHGTRQTERAALALRDRLDDGSDSLVVRFLAVAPRREGRR